MDFPFLFLLIEGVYVLVAVTIGLILRKRGKPYRVVLPVLHVIFAALIVTGMVTELVVGMPTYKIASQIVVAVSSLLLLGIVVVGVVMLVRKKRSMRLANLHATLVVLFSVTLVLGQILIFLKA